MITRFPTRRLPRTGQTTSYRAGDDGSFQAGFAGTRFHDNGDGTVADYATGLQGVKQPELMIPGAPDVVPSNQIQVRKDTWANSTAYDPGDAVESGPPIVHVCAVAHTSASSGSFADDWAANPAYWRGPLPFTGFLNPSGIDHRPMTWDDAIDNSLGLEYAGYADWRLPNYNELLSIIKRAWDPAPPTTYNDVFPNTQMSDYWTSSTNTMGSSQAHFINFIAAFDGYWQKDSMPATIYVRPVRGGL